MKGHFNPLIEKEETSTVLELEWLVLMVVKFYQQEELKVEKSLAFLARKDIKHSFNA